MQENTHTYTFCVFNAHSRETQTPSSRGFSELTKLTLIRCNIAHKVCLIKNVSRQTSLVKHRASNIASNIANMSAHV